MFEVIDIGDGVRSRPSRSLADLAKFHQVLSANGRIAEEDPEWGFDVVSHPGE